MSEAGAVRPGGGGGVRAPVRCPVPTTPRTHHEPAQCADMVLACHAIMLQLLVILSMPH